MTEKGIDFKSVDYLQERSLTANDLSLVLRQAGLEPQDALRKNEPAYQTHVAGKNLSNQELIVTMAEHPELIQRPIVVCGSKAVLARPSSKLTELGVK